MSCYRPIFHWDENCDGRAILTAICPNIKHIWTQSVLSAQHVGAGRTQCYIDTKRRLRVKLKCHVRYRYIGRLLHVRYTRTFQEHRNICATVKTRWIGTQSKPSTEVVQLARVLYNMNITTVWDPSIGILGERPPQNRKFANFRENPAGRLTTTSVLEIKIEHKCGKSVSSLFFDAWSADKLYQGKVCNSPADSRWHPCKLWSASESTMSTALSWCSTGKLQSPKTPRCVSPDTWPAGAGWLSRNLDSGIYRRQTTDIFNYIMIEINYLWIHNI